MKQPCEIVVWYVIPTIRSVLSKKLFELDMKQKDISTLLNITQPAVSQYLSHKRGGREVQLNDEIIAMINELAIDLKEEKAVGIDIIPRICKICRKIRADDILCILHKEKGGVPEECRICLSSNEGGSSCP